MNIEIVKNAVGTLEILLSRAKEALQDVGREEGLDPGYSGAAYEYPREAMKSLLVELHDVLLVVLEAADMRETRASLVKAWSGFVEGNGLTHTIINREIDSCDSPALTFLEHLIAGLRISVSDAISSEEAWTLIRLEEMLRDTAALVHRRQSPPANETDLQKIMHDYLSACFPRFTTRLSIAGTLKNFKPDCGIANLGAAIE